MMEKTLHEVCETYGVSRRAVQGYEKAGLVSASGKNRFGHLLYNEDAQEKIRWIKLYQQLGFQIREINELMNASDVVVKAALEKRIVKLKEEKVRLDDVIEKAYELINRL